MNSVLSKHKERIVEAVRDYQERLSDIQSDIVIRAMAPEPDQRELRLLWRLEEEYRDILRRFDNLSEAIEAVLKSP